MPERDAPSSPIDTPIEVMGVPPDRARSPEIPVALEFELLNNAAEGPPEPVVLWAIRWERFIDNSLELPSLPPEYEGPDEPLSGITNARVIESQRGICLPVAIDSPIGEIQRVELPEILFDRSPSLFEAHARHAFQTWHPLIAE
ncbi:hypothetical protein RYH80_18400 [Halobaculum sp. MBLA0147]|uniref:hypothetical protein n=1 Tax=Halobaculum sp. MBLA0147 TaxID=3079934 RepID=UPI003524B58E